MNLVQPKLKYESQRHYWNLDNTPNTSNLCMTNSFLNLVRYIGMVFEEKQFMEISQFSYLNGLEFGVSKGKNIRDSESHRDHINDMLSRTKITARLERVPTNLQIANEFVRDTKTPIVVGWDIDKYLPGVSTGKFRGHIVTQVGYNTFNDGYGNVNTHYKDHNGEAVQVPQETLEILNKGSKYMTIIRFKKEK